MSAILNIFIMVSTHFGAGRHMWDLAPAEVAEGLKVSF